MKNSHGVKMNLQEEISPIGEEKEYIPGRLCNAYEDLLHVIVKIREHEPAGEVLQDIIEIDESEEQPPESTFLSQDASVVRGKVHQLISRAVRLACEAGYADHHADDANLAISAFLDEAINRSFWSQKEQWKIQTLSMDLFNEPDSGDEFYKRLDRLMAQPTANRDVIEIYYLCICIGFKGKYIFEPDKLDPIKANVYRVVSTAIPSEIAELSVMQSKPRSAFSVIKQDAPPWLAYGITALVVLLLWLSVNIWSGIKTDCIMGNRTFLCSSQN